MNQNINDLFFPACPLFEAIISILIITVKYNNHV